MQTRSGLDGSGLTTLEAAVPAKRFAAVVAFVMSGHRSVYPSQVLGMVKTRSLGLRRGVEMRGVAKIAARPARVR